jgi:hypothetical protein
MANWASSSYVIEGPAKTLKKIYKAIKHPVVQEKSSEDWEGNVLLTLGINWEHYTPIVTENNEIKSTGYYLRGFIEECSFENNTIRINAEEAWGLTDFQKLLKQAFPDIKIYWITEEEGGEVYCTNDKEGKYFPERYYVDICIDDKYNSEYFETEEQVYDWLSRLTNGAINNEKDAMQFNERHKENHTDDENWIHIYKYTVVEDE